MSVVPSKYRGTKEYHLVFYELIRVARSRELTDYPQIAALVGLPPSGNHMQHEVGYILGEISDDEAAQGRPMLSALVVSTVTHVPGSGFYVLAQQLGKSPGSSSAANEAFWNQELEAVYATWQV